MNIWLEQTQCAGKTDGYNDSEQAGEKKNKREPYHIFYTLS